MLNFAKFYEQFNPGVPQSDKNVSFQGPQPVGFKGGEGSITQVDLKVPRKMARKKRVRGRYIHRRAY